MNTITYEERSKVYADALAAFGSEVQLVVAIEEMSELQKEICKALRGDIHPAHLAEELADATIMLEQVRQIFSVNQPVCDMMDSKILRLQRNIKKEQDRIALRRSFASSGGETSMTNQEAIERILDHMDVHHIGEPPHIHIGEALRMAITVLAEKVECRNPPSLTYEELQHMHGEPVYVTVPGKPHRSKWCIVDLTHPQPGLYGVEYFCSFDAVVTGGVKVYRHKPKEVNDECSK